MGDSYVVLAYEGLDGTVRRTRIDFSYPPKELSSSEAGVSLELLPKAEEAFLFTIACQVDEPVTQLRSYDGALALAGGDVADAKSDDCEIETSNEQFNQLLNRARADLQMMTTETAEGPYPYAGVPWFSTAFGRDGIITALECLWLEPEMAEGVLRYLASTQAKEVDADKDAEPGKILHEARNGEMAAMGEVPYGQYYGSVDAPALFGILAGEYYQRTGDRALIELIWPNIELALKWIDDYAAPDRGGFPEYTRRSLSPNPPREGVGLAS